jgi:hypothetical protein
MDGRPYTDEMSADETLPDHESVSDDPYGARESAA